MDGLDVLNPGLPGLSRIEEDLSISHHKQGPALAFNDIVSCLEGSDSP